MILLQIELGESSQIFTLYIIIWFFKSISFTCQRYLYIIVINKTIIKRHFIKNWMFWYKSDVGLHALESSKSDRSALVVIPIISYFPETSSPTSGYLQGEK